MKGGCGGFVWGWSDPHAAGGSDVGVIVLVPSPSLSSSSSPLLFHFPQALGLAAVFSPLESALWVQVRLRPPLLVTGAWPLHFDTAAPQACATTGCRILSGICPPFAALPIWALCGLRALLPPAPGGFSHSLRKRLNLTNLGVGCQAHPPI